MYRKGLSEEPETAAPSAQTDRQRKMADAGQGGDKANGKNRKRKPRYLPHNRPVKKGLHPLRPGVEGFFLTCDGGRERQATREALALVDRFYEEIVYGKCSDGKSSTIISKPSNKKIRFSDSDSSGSDDDEESQSHEEKENVGNCVDDTEENPTKKQRLDADIKKDGTTECDKTAEKSTDRQREDEFAELYDRNKRRFASLDSGCNGIIFIRMNKSSGDPGPAKIVEHLMTTAASTRKHMSRFILRLLPVEITCYASEEEISKAIKPLVAQYFPAEGTSQKFAVLYDARSNTGIERTKIIDVVAKSVPQPHKVDLNNPDKTIVVQIVKTVCLVGVVQRYKELAKYNLRQLTSPKG